MRKILIAPDSFKGSLTSPQVADAIEEGILKVIPGCQTVKIPVADGGEGTCEALVNARGGKMVWVEANDPLMRPSQAFYGLIDGGSTAVIEMAAASGLMLLSPQEYNPLLTTTFGTGQLIKDALKRDCRNFLIGIGGSATNDAGTGMLRALGYRFPDAGREKTAEGGQSLQHIVSVDESGMIPALKEARFTVACDVTNPFSGRDGAAYVYAPQKGANPAMVEALDKGLESFRQLVLKQKKLDLNRISGSGAAGGLGGGLVAFLNAELKPGIEMVLEAVNFKEHLIGADLVITGEGRLDGQTIQGKAPAGVLARAKQNNVPVIAIGGSVEEAEKLSEAGFLSVWPVVQGPCSLEEAMKPDVAKENIRGTVIQLMRIVQYFSEIG